MDTLMPVIITNIQQGPHKHELPKQGKLQTILSKYQIMERYGFPKQHSVTYSSKGGTYHASDNSEGLSLSLSL